MDRIWSGDLVAAVDINRASFRYLPKASSPVMTGYLPQSEYRFSLAGRLGTGQFFRYVLIHLS